MTDATTPADRYAHVERCIEVVRRGGMIVMVDDEDRENEGDLVIAADHCDAAAVNFMAKEGRGLICLSLTPDRVEQLQLPMMVPAKAGSMGTAFTVSVEAREGVTTGISAADRAETIRVASDDSFGAKDIVSPGHVFPLRAQPGGVLVRSGHTEGSVDVARLAGCRAAGVICEIIRDDGEMARMDDLEVFAERHGLLILTIADLIEYRLGKEMQVEKVAEVPFSSEALGLSAAQGWTAYSFQTRVEPTANYIALVKGEVSGAEPVLLRGQRAQVMGDVFGLESNDTRASLRAALQQIEREGRGVLLYVLGSGFGADLGFGDAPHNPTPGLRPGESGFRQFGLGAQVLRSLGVQKIKVMTDHPRKIVGLEGFGIEVVGSVPLDSDGDPA